MSSVADARFLFARAIGLIRRGWTSLHTRGWRASWARVRMQFGPRPGAEDTRLYAPAATPFAPFAVPHVDISRGAARQHRHPGLQPLRAYARMPARAGRASAACQAARSSSSTTAPATTRRPPCRRWRTCTTTAGRRTAASSRPATMARRSRAATCSSSSTTTPSRNRAGWTHCCRRSKRIPTRGWSARSCCTRTAGCRKPAAWCFPTAAVGTTGVSVRRSIRATAICAMPTTPAARRSPFRARCSPRSAASTRVMRRRTTKTPTSPSRFARPASASFTSRRRAWSMTKARRQEPTPAPA